MKNLINIFRAILLKLLLGFFSVFIKRKKGLLLFVPIHDKNNFSGNIKSLYLFVLQNEVDYKPIYFAKNKNNYNELKEHKLSVITGGRQLLYYSLIAEYIIIDGTTLLFDFKRKAVIQLWHGSGIKNVGIHNQQVKGFFKTLMLNHYKNYKFVSAMSDYDRLKHNNNFQIDSAIVTGLPKNDIFFSSDTNKMLLKGTYSLSSYNKIITYVPTYRDVYTINNFTEKFLVKLNELMISRNEIFIVKKHPWDTFFNIPNHLSNIKDFTNIIDDVQELLTITDVLISDYSSIVTDFSITKRPIIYYLFDHELYIKSCRSLVGNIEEYLPGPFVYNEEDLYKYMLDFEWFDSECFKLEIRSFEQKIHKYFDGNSSKRVFENIIN